MLGGNSGVSCLGMDVCVKLLKSGRSVILSAYIAKGIPKVDSLSLEKCCFLSEAEKLRRLIKEGETDMER